MGVQSPVDIQNQVLFATVERCATQDINMPAETTVKPFSGDFRKTAIAVEMLLKGIESFVHGL